MPAPLVQPAALLLLALLAAGCGSGTKNPVPDPGGAAPGTSGGAGASTTPATSQAPGSMTGRAAGSAPGVPPWTDVARTAGITAPLISGSPDKAFLIEAKGGGAAFLDYDNDGDEDLYVVNGATRESLRNPATPGAPTNHLYRNNGDWTFTDVTRQAGVGDTGWGYGCVVADYDNDGDADIYVANVGRNVLYRNNGDGTFTDVTDRAGVNDERYSTGATFGDFDGDGDLDLYVTNFVVFPLDNLSRKGFDCKYRGLDVMCGPASYPGQQDSFFRNEGNGTFRDITRQAGLMEPDPFPGFTPIFEDFDLNGTLDLFVPNDSRPNYMYRNLGNGRFVDEGSVSGVAFSEDGLAQASMGVAIGDYDRDGLMDIFLTHWYNDYNALFHNDGGLLFTDRSHLSGLGRPSYPYVSWGTFFFDYDNDGDLDLFVANGHTYPSAAAGTPGYRQSNMLFLNDGKGHFTDASPAMGEDFLRPKVSRGAAYADVDNDGDLDIFVTELDDAPTLLRNNLDNGNHFLSVRLHGTTSNRDAFGSRLELVAGGQHQYWSVRCGGSFLSHLDNRAFFGLGTAGRAELLKVTWPDGRSQEWRDIPADRFIAITQGDERLQPQ